MILKSDYHIHATLRQRLDAIHKLRLQHSIKTLCRVLNVNRSTYCKHFNSKSAPRIKENRSIRQTILQIYADCDKRVGAYKITHILERDYGIRVGVGRVYHLMNSMRLPAMSTEKPSCRTTKHEEGICHNHLNQEFNQKSPNLVWVSDITYLKAAGKWYYLCVILDLFSRKVISWELSPWPTASWWSNHSGKLTSFEVIQMV